MFPFPAWELTILDIQSSYVTSGTEVVHGVTSPWASSNRLAMPWAQVRNCSALHSAFLTIVSQSQWSCFEHLHLCIQSTLAIPHYQTRADCCACGANRVRWLCGWWGDRAPDLPRRARRGVLPHLARRQDPQPQVQHPQPRNAFLTPP
eukprot:3937150-Rhodomonas_salina.1